MLKLKYQIGDIVRLKKKHPCGADNWKIYRLGMDFGITCTGCGHHVMMPRPKFERMVVERIFSAAGAPDDSTE